MNVMFSREQLAQRIQELGKEVQEEFHYEKLTVICILKGAFLFCADLVRELSMPIEVEFVQLSSYGDQQESSGNVEYIKHIDFEVKNKNILIVEDIVDTGLTLHTFLNDLRKLEPKKIKVASLLTKPSKMKFPIDVDFKGFEIEDKFVVGYGLDDAHLYRDLPFIGVFEN